MTRSSGSSRSSGSRSCRWRSLQLLAQRGNFPRGYEAAAWIALRLPAGGRARNLLARAPLARTAARSRPGRHRRRHRGRRRPTSSSTRSRTPSPCGRCSSSSCWRRRSSSGVRGGLVRRARLHPDPRRRRDLARRASSASRSSSASLVLRSAGRSCSAPSSGGSSACELEQAEAGRAARGRGGAAAGRARPAGRRARSRQPLRPRARLLARARPARSGPSSPSCAGSSRSTGRRSLLVEEQRRSRDGDGRSRRRQPSRAGDVDRRRRARASRPSSRRARRRTARTSRSRVHRGGGAVCASALRARVLAPLQLGARPIGALALARREAGSFRSEEIELVTLLGRFVASAVQNIRTYEAERATCRGAATALGSARRLRLARLARAAEPDGGGDRLRAHAAAALATSCGPISARRSSAVIGDETNRLAALVGDVLDTSRIEAGTFRYTFGDGRRRAGSCARRWPRRSSARTEVRLRPRSVARCRRSAATPSGCASSSTT